MRDLPVIEDPWIGKTLDGRFEVLALLGKGGMGAIYRCREHETDTQMAVKIILAELVDDPEVVARFEREIKANCDIVHPNVVLTYGHGRTDEGTPYFAMELLKGRPLDEVVDDDGEMPSATVAHIGAQVARGLHAAHERGVIHRDLKPTNIVVGADGAVKVFDFGLSLLRTAGEPESRLTEMGMRIGTPLYMAPEYIEGGEVDARSDLYALGVLLYECCTGRVPFSGSAYQVLHKHANEPVVPIEERVPGRHPAWLRDAVEALLAKNPDDRPATGAAVAARLTRVPELRGPIKSLVPGTSPLPSTPRPVEPARPPPVAPAAVVAAPWPALGQVLLPFAVVAAPILHGFGVGANVGSPDQPLGRSMASLWTGAGLLRAGGNPYDMEQLQAFAAASGHVDKVPGLFAPPTWLALMGWTSSMEMPMAWAAWLGIQEALCLGCALLLWRSHQGLGRSYPVALLGVVAAMGAVAVALDQGLPAFVLLLCLLSALRARGDLEGGVMLGIAALVSPRAWILLPLWLVRGRFQAVGVALGLWLAGGAVEVALHGYAPTAKFWTAVVPSMFAGDFSGLGMRVDAFANHAPAHLLATVFPGPSGQRLSVVSLVLVWALGLAVVAGLALLHRERGDRWNEAAVGASWLLAVLALPIYGLEALVPLTIPATTLVLAAFWTGRLDPRLAVPVGIAVAVLLYPMEPLRQLYLEVFVPDLPHLAPLVREAKPAALAILASCTVWLSLPPHSE